MNLFRLFGRSAPPPPAGAVARERLTILLAHERALGGGKGDLVARLREEIIAVVARHVPIERDRVQVKFDRGPSVSTLEIDIEVPLPVAAAAGLAA